MKIEDFVRKNEQPVLRLHRYEVEEGVELPLLEFPLFDEIGWVGHGFSTREGGVSEDIFSTLNFSFTRGDNPAHVQQNYRRLAEAFGVRPEDFVCTDQTHTTNVIRVGHEERGIGVTRQKPYSDVDGLVTNTPGVVLSTFFADCVPLFFVDPVHRAIGMSHSGWRGTVQRMGQVTLEVMAREFQTRAEDVLCAIAPSICQDCYEISADVAAEFSHAFCGHEREILREGKPGKYQLDLWKCNEIVLLEAGVLPQHLAVTNICTCCNPKLLFSHRASQGRRGNLGAFIFIS